MRTLAVDLGSRRVGLALSDEGGHFAMPIEVVEVTDPLQAIEPIVVLVKKEGIRRIVIGLPLNMDDGSIGSSAKSVICWGGKLAMKVMVPILYVDERLSSFQAEQDIIAQKRAGEHITRQMKKEQLDARAAAVFLQDFLDGRLQPVELP